MNHRLVQVVVVLLTIYLLSLPPSGSAPIGSLPDYFGPSVNQSSGYIVVNEANGRAIFYWLVESSRAPATDPLVIWFQGGPGCSGLFGLLTENGPFRPDLNGGLEYNPHGWHKVANLLYIEAPAGVGFSYSNTTKDYATDDEKTAQDNYLFIQGFLKEYPQYNGRDLWLAGESYAGVYIPTLAEKILGGSNLELRDSFKGLLLGNPVMLCKSVLSPSLQFNMYFWHGLVSYSHYQTWIDYDCDENPFTLTCAATFVTARNEIGEIVQENVPQQPSLDPDDLYQDFCTGNATLEFTQSDPTDCDPVGLRLDAYLNRRDVQEALHVQPTRWSSCTSRIIYARSGQSLIPYYRFIFQQKPELRILFYSGDVDIATIPFAFTAGCLAELSSDVTRVTKWEPWFVNGATAGYVEQFNRYTFATLKGAGHEAPLYQPLNSYHLFERFITKGNLTDSSLRRASPKASTRNNLNQGVLLRKYFPLGL